jgi:riboflavin synthase
MFTGIVEARQPARFRSLGGGAELTVPLPGGAWEVELGDSVSVSGACLTVAALADAAFPSEPGDPDPNVRCMRFDLSAETLARTWFADEGWVLVNLERAMRMSDRLGGHMVSGHVDGLAELTRVVDRGDRGFEMHFCVPAELERFLVDKGSIAIDGISLTVVEPRGREFKVAVIPETLKRTTLAGAQPGRRVHVEADLIGKWIERLLRERSAV